VYALGCMLFEMVTGQPPFRRENEYATMYAHTSDPAPPCGVSPALDAVVARALAKEPEQRYQSAGDFARAVAAAVAGQSVPSEPERTVAVGRAAAATAVEPPGHPVYGYGLDPETTVLPQKSRNGWIALAAVLALLFVGGVVAAVVVLSKDDKPAVQQTSGPTLRDGVTQLAAALDLSQQGRTLTIAGQYSKAIANRQQVLDRIDALTLAPQLEPSRALLRQAVQASLDADQALLQCKTCASTQAANQRATDLKQRFVAEFNRFATQYLQRSFSADSL
jgi:hypothetical protein